MSSRKPDLTGKRHRKTVHQFLNRKLLKEFKKEISIHDDLDIHLFKEIITTFNSIIWEKSISEFTGISLPQNLGSVTCTKFKGKSLQIDRQKTLETGKTAYFQNWKTEGYNGKISYNNYRVMNVFPDSKLWGFTPCRNYQRTFGKNFPKDYHRYLDTSSPVTKEKGINRPYNVKACHKQ